METKQRKVGFARALSNRYGIFASIAGAFVILSLIYIFTHIDLLAAIDATKSPRLLKTILAAVSGLVGVILIAWIGINSFRRRVYITDAMSLMILIAMLGGIGIYFIDGKIDFSNLNSIPKYLFIFAAVAILAAVLLIIHACRYKYEEGYYNIYKGYYANGSLVKYYRELFKAFPLSGTLIIAILCIIGIILIDANEAITDIFNGNTGQMMVIIIAGVAIVSYILGIISRIIKQKINIIDLGIFMLDIGALVGVGVAIYSFITSENQEFNILKLVVSIAAVIFGILVTFILANRIYIPGEEAEEQQEKIEPVQEDVQEEKQEESQEEIEEIEEIDEIEEEKQESQEEEAVEPQEEIEEPMSEEDINMAEQITVIIDRLDEQQAINKNINDRLERIDNNLQLIADILKGMSFDALSAGTHAIKVDEEETPAIEEVAASTAEDYFDKVEEEKKIEKKNEKIVDDYIEDDGEYLEEDGKNRIKSKLSFEMKLRVAEDKIKSFYSDIKNELLSYGVHDRISRHRENFNYGRRIICRMAINGKTLKVYLPIDPTSLDESYFHHEDVGHRKGLVDLPTMINVRSKVAARKVKELIKEIMDSNVILKKDYTPQDFASQLTLDGYTVAQAKGYDYLVENSITLDKASAFPDSFAEALVVSVEDDSYKERFIKVTVTLDDLSKHFKDGDIIDIDAIREKKIGAPNANFLYVDESKKLDKKFKVYANDYNVNAIKMINLTGGETFLVVQPEQTLEEV